MRARSTIAAAALVLSVTAGGLLTACGPNNSGSASASSSKSPAPVASGSGAGSASAAPTTGGGNSGGTTGGGSGATTASWSGPGTAGLTVSNGTNRVLINGSWVDFGVVVRDLAWSPDGSKAAFVDGSGNLDVADPDGSHRVTVARNPGNQAWSHPTWQVIPASNPDHVPARDNLFFVAGSGASSKLMQVPATAVDGTPTALGLNGAQGSNTPPPPTAGNTWINGGYQGDSVYANSVDGGVYLRDDYLRQMGWKLTNGSEPAMMSGQAAEEIVFVRSVAGHDHLFEESGQKSSVPVDLTPNATTDYTEPAISPDGQSIAARTPSGIEILPLTGTGSAAPRLVTTATGLPAYRP
ncbi:PD40 domain-containing protein [Streptacidiphilus fuscans]|uniref:PD40 domain-containing protein n=1 Tax=Streptacidiphilus fuscans TaxID=2789292 RepID=A0A931FHI1_9ACTN|nr:PD40 domain-containing protein [Streptacidiphilus fuscans]MBF9070699.1 PD40 domain-containing protein [Streptacidiphilus fuscans]